MIAVLPHLKHRDALLGRSPGNGRVPTRDHCTVHDNHHGHFFDLCRVDHSVLVLHVDGRLDLLGMTRALEVLCRVEDGINRAAGEGRRDTKSHLEPADGYGRQMGYDLRWHCETIWPEGMVWILNGFETYASEPMPHDPNPDTVRVIGAFHPRPDWTDQRLAAWSLGQVLVDRGIAIEVVVS